MSQTAVSRIWRAIADRVSALTDGVELRVDLGSINGRPFVNNASFGAYAEMVRRPEYRDGKTHTALQEEQEHVQYVRH